MQKKSYDSYEKLGLAIEAYIDALQIVGRKELGYEPMEWAPVSNETFSGSFQSDKAWRTVKTLPKLDAGPAWQNFLKEREGLGISAKDPIQTLEALKSLPYNAATALAKFNAESELLVQAVNGKNGTEMLRLMSAAPTNGATSS